MTTRTVTRRSALATMGAGFFAWPAAVQAMSPTVPEFTLIVVSDTHLGRDDNEKAVRQWEKTAAEIDRTSGDFVLHLGDIVDAGREKQYDAYKSIRKSIRKPVCEIPGNHDRPEQFAKHVREQIDTTFDHRGVRFMLMNDSRYGDIDGYLTQGQLKWLGRRMDDAADRGLWLVLAMHVAAHDNRLPEAGAYLKPAGGQKELYALVDKHRARVLAMLHGHFHCGLRGWSDRGPVQEIVFPSALYNRNQLLTEFKAPGYNLPEFRPGFTTVALRKDGMSLRYQPVGVDASVTKELETAGERR